MLAEFAGRTGLPAGAQVSVAKLLHLRNAGVDLRDVRWFNLPEFVAATMGADGVSEYSLASRTGLLDQDTGQPWLELLEHLGAVPAPAPTARGRRHAASARPGADWVPPGSPVPRSRSPATTTWSPPCPPAPSPDDRYHVSMGTAEVLLRVVDEPLPFDARAELAEHLINSRPPRRPGPVRDRRRA